MLVVAAQQTGIDSTRSGGAAVTCKCGKPQKNKGLQWRPSADGVVESETTAERQQTNHDTDVQRQGWPRGETWTPVSDDTLKHLTC